MKRQTSTEIEWITYDVHSIAIFTARKRSLGQGNVFTPVCHSAHGGGGGGLCMISLLVRLPGPMFLRGVSVSVPMFLPGGLPDRDPLGQRYPGQRPPDRDPPDSPLLYGKERALRILLECILV